MVHSSLPAKASSARYVYPVIFFVVGFASSYLLMRHPSFAVQSTIKQDNLIDPSSCPKTECPPVPPLAAVTKCPPAPSPAAVTESCESDEKRLVIPLQTGNRGGHGRWTEDEITKMVAKPTVFDIFEDLLAFTGLSKSELMDRISRKRQFHFAVEHDFHAPHSKAELAFYYRLSSCYLWANAIHAGINVNALNLTSADGPVLDYSGGVGSTNLALATEGIPSVYFGIGLMEFEFAQFRVRRHGFADLVTFVRPYTTAPAEGEDSAASDNKLRFDPIYSLQLNDTIPEQLGAVFALDVFEHIPDYHITARHIISLLRPGGKLFENSPFDSRGTAGTEIHLKQGMPLQEAFIGMKYIERTRRTNPPVQIWEKQAQDLSP